MKKRGEEMPRTELGTDERRVGLAVPGGARVAHDVKSGPGELTFLVRQWGDNLK